MNATLTPMIGNSLLDDVFDSILKPQCFAAGTLVHTKEGLVPIEKIQVGDWVLSRCEYTGEQAYKRVVNLFQHEPQVVVEIHATTADAPDTLSTRLVCTRDHPFWVKNRGWLKAENLSARWNSGERFILADGSDGLSRGRFKIYVTDQPGVGWKPTHSADEEEPGFQWDYFNEKFVANEVLALQGLRDWREEHEHPMYQPPEEFLFKLPVFNIEVEDFHTYFVGELGVWVHNACGLLTLIDNWGQRRVGCSQHSSCQLVLVIRR